MKNNIINQIDESFVNNYNDIKKYQLNFNIILSKLDMPLFETYNDFCINIRNNAIDKIKKEKIKKLDLDTNFFSEIIGKTLRVKIKKNRNYEKKLMEYFNDYTLIDFLKNDN